MARRFSGQLLLVVNGLPILHVKQISEKSMYKRELVQGISIDDAPQGYVDGPEQHTLDIQVYVPVEGDIAWGAITDGVIAAVEKGGGSPRDLYTGVFVTEVGSESSDAGGPMIRSISAQAVRKVSL